MTAGQARIRKSAAQGRIRALIVRLGVAAVLGAWLTTSDAAAQVPCSYDVTVLPNFNCFGSAPGNPVAINNLGHVLLVTTNCGEPSLSRSHLWTGGTSVTQIIPPTGYAGARAQGLNDRDEIVGYITRVVPVSTGGVQYVNEACLWRNGQAIPLGIPEGGNYSIATGINNHSEICGYWGNSNFGNPALRAFIWRDGVMSDLVLPFGVESMASDINDNSQITGWMGIADTIDSHCYRWSPNGVADLGTVDGGYTAEGMAISENGQVSGRGRVAVKNSKAGRMRAAVWQGSQQVVISDLPLTDNMYVWDANNFAVVGQADRPNAIGDRAFLLQNGVTSDLTDSTPGYVVWNAQGINQRGQILASGKVNGGAQRTMVLTPNIRSTADVTRDCRVGVSDLIAVITEWRRLDSFADTNNDGIVDLLDLLRVIENWSS